MKTGDVLQSIFNAIFLFFSFFFIKGYALFLSRDYEYSFIILSGNGYIEGTELDGFLREFVSSANATDISPEVSYIFLTKHHF